MKNKTKVIQIFPTMADAFEWVTFKMLDATIGDLTTTKKFQGNDAVICECDETIYVGLYNVQEL
jgi:hypothetical protein